MKAKTIGILTGITLLGILVTILVNQEPAAQLPRSGELLFPHLLPKINEIKEVVVATHDQTVTLVRGEKMWKVKEKEEYPADVEKVKQAILGLAELRILEPKTKNPELYDRLGLQDPEQEGSLSTAVMVKIPDNPEAVSLIVGNQRPAKGNPRMSDIYVRQPEEPQTWLVIGNLPLEHMAGEWLEKEITALPAKRVHRVTVTHPNGETLRISKENHEDMDFQVDSLPEGFQVASQFNVNNVVGTLVQLSLENVKKEGDVDFHRQPGVKAVVETFDGLRLHVQTAKEQDKIFGKVSAEFDPALIRSVETDSASHKEADASQTSAQNGQALEVQEGEQPAEPSGRSPEEESVLKSPDEVQKEVMAFNERVQGWAYELPKFRVENFSKTRKDLIEKIS